MTTIDAKVIADGINAQGNRLRSVLCRYPKWIHGEGRTHRQLLLGEEEFKDWEPRTPSPMEDRNLSRNASSSRAIPVSRLVEDVMIDPAIPLVWGRKQPGMQGGEDWNAKVTMLTPTVVKDDSGQFILQDIYRDFDREAAWLRARDEACKVALAFDAAGYHKQVVNRLLEPFMHINVLYTGTEWANFFALRIHNAAEPHICLLATKIDYAFLHSEPKRLEPGEWQMPFTEDIDATVWVDKIKISVARCAHLSYETVAGEPIGIEQSHRIYAKLLGDNPIHASPAEHQATPDSTYHSFALGVDCWEHPNEHGNLVGWRQYRKQLPGEVAGKFEPPKVWKLAVEGMPDAHH